MKIGIISDTHGLVRKEVMDTFADCSLIIHAGDVGSQAVLNELKTICPVVAVRGNIDNELTNLNKTEVVELGHNLIYVLHNIKELDIDPKAAGISIVMYGHSHKFSEEWKEGVLYLNPGSAGPRRFNLPISAATLDLDSYPKISCILLQ